MTAAPPVRFHLDPTARAVDEVKRLLAEQRRLALWALYLDDRQHGVHELRKACKRARAVALLADPAVGRDARRALAAAFRDASRALSARRDADVMKQTIADLVDDPAAYHPVVGPSAVDLDGVATARRALDTAEQLIRPLDTASLATGALLDGITAGYRAARKGLARVERSRDPEVWHAFRKAFKAHYYHLQLVQPTWAPVIGAMVAQADQLQETLGDRNDLAVLERALARASLSPSEATRLRDRLVDRTRELDARALRLAGPMLAVRPRAVREVLAGLWANARRPQDDDPRGW